MNRWSKNGVLDRVFEHLQREQILRIKLEVLSIDSTVVKVHPDGTGRLKKNGPQSIGKSRGGWTSKIHLVAADAGTALRVSLSPGQAHGRPRRAQTTPRFGSPAPHTVFGHDRAYQDNQTRQLALALGFTPVVPPLRTRVDPWEYDHQIYKRRHEIERLFRRLKGYRRIFSRYEKLDASSLDSSFSPSSSRRFASVNRP